MCRTLGISGGRGEKRVAGGESTRARLQYLSAPESGGRQPRTHHDLNDPLLLGPKLRSSVLGTAPTGKTKSCSLRRNCRHPVAPQRRTCRACRCRNSWHQGRRNVRHIRPLPQQLAKGTPQRLWQNEPRSQNMLCSRPSRSTEPGRKRTHWERWQQRGQCVSSIYIPPRFPGGLSAAACIEVYVTRDPCSLALLLAR